MKLMRPRTTRLDSHSCAVPVARAMQGYETGFAAVRAVVCLTPPGPSATSATSRNQTRTGSRKRFAIIGDSRRLTVAPDGVIVRDGRLYHGQAGGGRSLRAHRGVCRAHTATDARRVGVRGCMIRKCDAPLWPGAIPSPAWRVYASAVCTRSFSCDRPPAPRWNLCRIAR